MTAKKLGVVAENFPLGSLKIL